MKLVTTDLLSGFFIYETQLGETIHIYNHNFRNNTRNAKKNKGISHAVKKHQ